MSVDEWFWEWVRLHCERFPRGDWPGQEKEYWQELRHMFVTKGVSEEVATLASREMFQFPAPEFVSEHPAVILARVREVWRKANGAATPKPAATTGDDWSEWNRLAYAHWDTLDEGERDEARKLVRERAPFVRRSPGSAEKLAIGWAYDPSSVIGPEPPRERVAKLPRGVKQVFSHPKFVE